MPVKYLLDLCSNGGAPSYAVLRFDYRGMGDSTGTQRDYRLRTLYAQ